MTDCVIFYPLLVATIATLLCIPAWIQLQKLSKTHRQYFWRYITLILINGSLIHLMTQPVARGVLSSTQNVLIISSFVSLSFIISEYWCILALRKYGHGGLAFTISNFLVPVLTLLVAILFLVQRFQPRGLIYFGAWLWTFLLVPVWMYEYLKVQCNRWWKYALLIYAAELTLFLNPSPRMMESMALVPLFCTVMVYARTFYWRKKLDSNASLILFYYILPTLFILGFELGGR